MAKYQPHYLGDRNVVKVWTNAALTDYPSNMESGTSSNPHIVWDVEIVARSKTFIIDGYTYADANVIRFKCNASWITDSGASNSGGSGNVVVTRYAIESYKSSNNGLLMKNFDLIEGEEVDKSPAPSVPSDTGTSDPIKNDPIKNDPIVLQDAADELNDSDKDYFSYDLYANGIFTSNTAKTAAESLRKFGGASNVSMRLFGMPYQFMPNVDSRINTLSTRVGTQFLQNIISEAAIITITPGKPIYMGNYGGSAATKTAYLIQQTTTLNNIAQTQKNLSKQIKYYDFQEDYISYMHYVNMMCRSAAGFMGLDSVPVDSDIKDVLARFDWKNYRFNGIGYNTVAGNMLTDIGNALSEAAKSFGDGVQKFCSTLCDSLSNNQDLGSSIANAWSKATAGETSGTVGQWNKDYPNSPASIGTTDVSLADLDADHAEEANFLNAALNYLGINENFVQFMIEPGSFTEASSNQTTQSQLLSAVNDTLGSQIREIRFVAGSVGAQGLSDMASDAAQGLLDALGSLGGNMSTNVVARVTGSMSQLMAGDRIIFPEVFDKSEYRKDYSLTIKLKSPYGDRYSYYMNILVPLFHLIGLAAPHQTSGNTYDSPFLVRVFLPGMWQLNMGIVTDLSIERNGNDGLSIDGYPLELNVTLQIKDLYSDLMITPTTEPSLFLCNTGLVDFIMIQCGLDVTNKNYTTKLNNAVISIGNSYKDIFTNVADSVNQKASEFVTNLVSGIIPGARR